MTFAHSHGASVRYYSWAFVLCLSRNEPLRTLPVLSTTT